MIIDPKTGRIAYHGVRFDVDGGSTWIQYGFEGEILEERKLRPASVYVPRERTWLEKLLGMYENCA